MKSISQIKFWSNIFFLVPLAVALWYHIIWYSIIIGLVFVISSYFHFKNEKKLEYVDVTSSSTLMVANVVLLFLGHWMLPYSVIAIGCAVLALIFYARQFKYEYNFNHGIWHLFSAGVCLFCLFTLLAFMHVR